MIGATIYVPTAIVANISKQIIGSYTICLSYIYITTKASIQKHAGKRHKSLIFLSSKLLKRQKNKCDAI